MSEWKFSDSEMECFERLLRKASSIHSCIESDLARADDAIFDYCITIGKADSAYNAITGPLDVPYWLSELNTLKTRITELKTHSSVSCAS